MFRAMKQSDICTVCGDEIVHMLRLHSDDVGFFSEVFVPLAPLSTAKKIVL